MTAAPQTRILLVRTGALGDILHALPAVTALRLLLPQAVIGWCIAPQWQPLLSPQLVDQLHLVPTRAWKRRPFSPATLQEILVLRRQLRAQRYDLAVDLQGSLRSALLARLSAAPQVVGSASPREQPARLLYRLGVTLRQASVIHQAAEILSAALPAPIQPAPPQLPVNPMAEFWCDAQSLPPRFVLLNPDAGWGAKRWPACHYAALTQALLAAGHPVLVSTDIASAAPPEIVSAGARVVPSTLPQLIALTRRAALVVGGDTGPVHLAAALLRPTVALFGPTDPARNGPHFPHARVTILRHASSSTSLRRNAAPDPGLKRITVEQVLAACSFWLHPRNEA